MEMNTLQHDCRQLLSWPWTVEVNLIYREANDVADGLAHWVLGCCIGSYFHAIPPLSIHTLLFSDQVGLGRPRIVMQNGLQCNLS